MYWVQPPRIRRELFFRKFILGLCPCLKAGFLLFLFFILFGGVLRGVSCYGHCFLHELNFNFRSCVDLGFPIILDWARRRFLSVVVFISCNVIVFSSFYIGEDVNKSRFSWLVIMFVASIALLILIPNFLVLIVG